MRDEECRPSGSHKNITIEIEYKSERLFLSYYTKGKGNPPIVILHGLGGSHLEWERLVLPYLHTEQRIIVPDQPGHGSSGVIQHATLDDLVEILKIFLKRLRIKKAILVGQSMGAALALMFTAEYPHMVAGVAVQGAPYHIPDHFCVLRNLVQYFRIRLKLYPPIAELWKGIVLFFKLPQIVAWFFETEDMRAISPEFQDRIIGYDSRHIAAEVYLDLLYDFADFDIREKIARIPETTPVILIDGDKVKIPFVDTLSPLSQFIPHAQTHVVKNAGHLAPLSHPEEFCRVLGGFIKKVTA